MSSLRVARLCAWLAVAAVVVAAAERRLARKLGGARQLEYVTSQYSKLDRSGHWRS
jgi:hypothetical protein